MTQTAERGEDEGSLPALVEEGAYKRHPSGWVDEPALAQRGSDVATVEVVEHSVYGVQGTRDCRVGGDQWQKPFLVLFEHLLVVLRALFHSAHNAIGRQYGCIGWTVLWVIWTRCT
jgi:hypothetical protein